MIRGVAVDWANHADLGGPMIEEQLHFNDAVQAVVHKLYLTDFHRPDQDKGTRATGD